MAVSGVGSSTSQGGNASAVASTRPTSISRSVQSLLTNLTSPPDRDRHEPSTIEVFRGNLRDEREVRVRDTGIVVTHRISPTGASSVEFQVIDPFPGAVDAAESAFHRGHEPPHGRIANDSAVVGGVVGADDELVVRYGLRTVRPLQSEDVGTLQSTSAPSIEFARTVDHAPAEEADLERPSMARSAGAGERDDADPSADFEWFRRGLADPSSETDGVDVGDDSTPVSEHPEPDPRSSRSGGGVPPNEPVAADETGTSVPAPVRPPDEGTRRAATGDGGGPETARDEPGRSAAGSSRCDVVGALLEDLETGSLDVDGRRRLIAALDDLLTSDGSRPPGTGRRLRKLEADVQTIEAYAEALEAIIDEHGTAEEFLATVRDDIASLERTLETLGRDLDRERETSETLEEGLASVDDDVAALDTRLDRVDEQADRLRASQRSTASRLEEEVERLEPAAEKVEELAAEMESLGAAIEEVQRRHRAISRALTGADGDRA